MRGARGQVVAIRARKDKLGPRFTVTRVVPGRLARGFARVLILGSALDLVLLVGRPIHLSAVAFGRAPAAGSALTDSCATDLPVDL